MARNLLYGFAETVNVTNQGVKYDEVSNVIDDACGERRK